MVGERDPGNPPPVVTELLLRQDDDDGDDDDVDQNGVHPKFHVPQIPYMAEVSE